MRAWISRETAKLAEVNCATRADGRLESRERATHSPDFHHLTVTPRHILALAGFIMLTPQMAFAQLDPKLFEEVTRPQIEALQRMKAARTPAQQKIDSALLKHLELDRLPQPARDGARQIRPLHQFAVTSDADQRVAVVISGTVAPELLAAIGQQGGQVVTSSPESRLVQALLPLKALEPIASRSDVETIRTVPESFANQSPTTMWEGVVAHAADQAQSRFAAKGSGIKVCVISNNVYYLGTQPSPAVTILADANGNLQDGLRRDLNGNVLPAGPGDGEGTAMLRIINKVAPDATLMFAASADPSTGADKMKDNIDGLAATAAGCKIIVDDITGRDEPPFQDGPVSKAVSAATAKGILYFSSAGNYGNLKSGTSQVWEGDYAAGSAVAGGNNHQFQAGVQASQANTLYPPVANDTNTGKVCPFTPIGVRGYYRTTGVVNLFWNDPLGASANDYDLYVVNVQTGEVFDSSTNVQNGHQNPYEWALVAPNTAIMVVKHTAAAPRHLRVDIQPSCGRLQYATEGSTRGHNAAESAVTVAGVSAAGVTSRFPGGPDVSVEVFSSDGPRRMYFDASGNPYTPNDYTSAGGRVLSKPDLAAASSVNTDVPGFQPFRGTSAAAPHAAAIAALVWSSQPNFTASQVLQALRDSTLRIDGTRTGGTFRAGLGIVMADTTVNDADSGRKAASTYSVTRSNGTNVADKMSWDIVQYAFDPNYFLLNYGWSRSMRVTFSLSQQPTQDMRFYLTSVAAGSWPTPGFVPINVTVNGTAIATGYNVSADGGAWNPVTSQFVIPQSRLQLGNNSIQIDMQPSSTSDLWVHSLQVLP